MPSLLGILIWDCVLIIATSAIQALGEEINGANLRSRDGAKVRQVRGAKRPSCSISISEDEAYRLTKLLNGFINVFAATTEPAAVDFPTDEGSNILIELLNGFINVFSATTEPTSVNSPRDEGSNILVKLLNGFINVFAATTEPTAGISSRYAGASGISGLETSVWRILNRVLLATSYQYSENEFDQALREVEREADKILVTIYYVDVVLRNTTVKTDYYHDTVPKVRATLLQAVERMKEAQNSSRCHSSAVKQMTANFEEALQEIKTQKETIAGLQKEMRETRATVSLQNEEMVMRGLELAECKVKMRQVAGKQAEKDNYWKN